MTEDMMGHDPTSRNGTEQRRPPDAADTDTEPSGQDSVAASARNRDGAGSDTATEPRSDAKRKSITALVRRIRTRNGRYYIDLRDLGLGRVALKPAGSAYATKDPDVAVDLAAEILRDVLVPERERHFATKLRRVATVGAFAREWFEFARDRAGNRDAEESDQGFASLVTLHRYEQALKQLFRVMDQDILMHQLTLGDIKRAIRDLRQAVTRSGQRTSASSLHQIITAMQLIYDHAADEGVVINEYNPWRKLKRQDRPSLPRQSRTDFLEIYEAHAFIEACEGVTRARLPLRVLVATYLYTGGRKNEVLGLDVQDIDFRAKIIRFVSNRWRSIKDYDERTVPLHPTLERILRRYLAEHPRISGLLFPGQSRHGEEQMITAYAKSFAKAKEIAVRALGDADGQILRAKAVNPRVFRVTYCSARLQTTDHGKPIALITVEAEMGHNSGAMIKRVYGRVGRVRSRSEHVEYVSRADLERAENRAMKNRRDNA